MLQAHFLQACIRHAIVELGHKVLTGCSSVWQVVFLSHCKQFQGYCRVFFQFFLHILHAFKVGQPSHMSSLYHPGTQAGVKIKICMWIFHIKVSFKDLPLMSPVPRTG